MKTLLHDALFLSLYSLTSILALVGNGLVFRVTLQHRQNLLSHFTISFPLSTTRIILLHLAFADTLLGLTIPLQLVFCSKYLLDHVSYSSHICAAIKFLQIVVYNASTLTICLIAFDRYRVIENPLRKYYPNRLSRALLLIWVLSSLFSGVCFVFAHVHTYFQSVENLITCQTLLSGLAKRFSYDRSRQTRIVCVLIPFYIIPLLLITILCILTMRVISRRLIIGVQRFRTFEQSRTRSLGLLLVTATVFALSRSPIHVLYLQELLSSSSNDTLVQSTPMSKCNNSTLYLLFYWLNISSCCHNPIIYSWYNRRFRTLVFQCCQRPLRYKRQRSVFYQS